MCDIWYAKKKDRWRSRNLSYTKDKTRRTTLRATVVRTACFYYVFTTNDGIDLPRSAPFCHFDPESWIVCIKKQGRGDSGASFLCTEGVQSIHLARQLL